MANTCVTSKVFSCKSQAGFYSFLLLRTQDFRLQTKLSVKINARNPLKRGIGLLIWGIIFLTSFETL